MKILIIDDDSIHSWIVQKFIERENPEANVMVFTDASEALTQLINNKIEANLIILDWFMPKMNGCTFAHAFARLYQNHIPIVVLTNSIYHLELFQSVAFSVIKGYFKKPVDTSMIQEILSYAQDEKD